MLLLHSQVLWQKRTTIGLLLMLKKLARRLNRIPNLTPNHDGNQAQNLAQNASRQRLLLLAMLGIVALATAILVS